MRHADAGLGCRLAHALDGVLDGVHAVAHVVDLAPALDLAADGVGDHVGIPLADRHLHGQASRWRREDERHVAHAAHGHLHGAWYGRGGEREHVHLLPHVLELLLVLHAKALLLVDDHESQVMWAHVCGEQAVRADEHVHRALAEALKRAALPGGRHEAREHLDVKAKGGKARIERLEVLLRQDRRGTQHHHLSRILAALEGGAQGHLRLAKAHVTAEQAIHGSR